MDVTFDRNKDAANSAKHGLPLSDAVGIELGDAMVWPDGRRDYGEVRMVGLVPLGSRLFHVVFVDRPAEQPTERRIISLRKANSREVKRYANNC